MPTQAIKTLISLIPPHFSYVLFALIIDYALNSYLIYQVMAARHNYDIKYPQLYADPTEDGKDTAFKFNSI